MENGTFRILVALDGSHEGEGIVAALMPALRRAHPEITLLHVVKSGGAEDAARAYLDKARRALETHGIAATVRIASGRPAEEIPRIAAESAFDWVAMFHHGRSGLPRPYLESVTEEVLQRTSASVLACRSGGRVGGWERIVVPLDGTPMSEEILPEAVRYARLMGSTLHVLRVGLCLLPPAETRGTRSYPAPSQDLRRYIDSISDRLAGEGVVALGCVRKGSPAGEIVRFSRELNAGLIAMTSEGQTRKEGMIGRSVAQEVVRNAPCPVLVRRRVKAVVAPGIL